MSESRIHQFLFLTLLLIPVVSFQNCGGLRAIGTQEDSQISSSSSSELSNPSLPASTPTPVPTSTATPTPSTTSSGCQTPLKHFQFVIQQDFYLGKDTDTVYQVKVPAVGRAFARWNGRIYNESANTHGWQGLVLVGNHTLSNAQLGDDIYGYETRSVMPIGIGQLTASNQNVKIVLGDAYVDNPSYPQKGRVVRGLAGTSLDVWVEDSSCLNQQIHMSQYYDFIWPTTMTRSAYLNLELFQPRRAGKMTIIGVSEGSTPSSGIPANPNMVQGAETATLATHLRVAGNIYNQKILPIPASQGQGHLAFSNEVSIDYAQLPLQLTVALDVGSNIGNVTVNGPTILVVLYEDR